MIDDRQLTAMWVIAQGYPEPMEAFARAVEREARQQALEEAAKVCEGLFSGDDCAAEIRALTKKEEIEK